MCGRHYDQTPERIEAKRSANQAWARKSPAKKEAGRRAWVAANRDQLNARERRRQQEWRDANPGAASAKLAAWIAANPERWAQINRAHNMARRARMRTTQVEPIDLALVLAEHGEICHICGGDIPFGDLHFDHVIPLARHGTHTYDNLRPAHSRCNLRKGSRVA